MGKKSVTGGVTAAGRQSEATLQLPENWYKILAEREGLLAAAPLVPR
jgi:hypothetical protein